MVYDENSISVHFVAFLLWKKKITTLNRIVSTLIIPNTTPIPQSKLIPCFSFITTTMLILKHPTICNFLYNKKHLEFKFQMLSNKLIILYLFNPIRESHRIHRHEETYCYGLHTLLKALPTPPFSSYVLSESLLHLPLRLIFRPMHRGLINVRSTYAS